MVGSLLLLSRVALAAPGAELVLILDDRRAVERGSAGRGQELAAEALLRAASARGDRVSVVGLAEDGRSPPVILMSAEAVAALEPVSRGDLGPALDAARAILATSDREARGLILVASGDLAGGMDPAEARRALGSDPSLRLGVVGLGVQEPILDLAPSPWDRRALEASAGAEAVATAIVDLSAATFGAHPDLVGEHLVFPPTPDLVARVALREDALAGDRVGIRAWLERGGLPVADPAAALGAPLEVALEVDGSPVPFAALPDGSWGGRWTATGPSGSARASFRVRDARYDLRAEAAIAVEGALSPVVLPQPTTVELGTWESGWRPTSRCAEIDLSGSIRAEQLDLVCAPSDPRDALFLYCEPATDPVPGEPVLRWRVCARAGPCCGDQPVGDDPLDVRFIQRDERRGTLLATIPVHLSVRGQNPLLCRGPGLLLATALAGLTLAALGLGRAPRFKADLTLKLASSEPALRGARPFALRPMADASRPLFGRRVAFDEQGGQTSLRGPSALVLEPTSGGGARVLRGEALERRLPRSRGWEVVDETERISGLLPGCVYRVGARLYFTLA